MLFSCMLVRTYKLINTIPIGPATLLFLAPAPPPFEFKQAAVVVRLKT